MKSRPPKPTAQRNDALTGKHAKRPPQCYDLVEIWWDDAANFPHGWDDTVEPPEPNMVISVGFLLQETKEHIQIVQDLSGREYNGKGQIPTGMVKRMRVLRKKDPA